MTTAVLSPERTGRITGSRIASVLGLNKYETRDQLLRTMVREHFGAESEFTGNEATEWGQAHEQDAIDEYERTTGRTVHGAQELVKHPDYPDLFAVTPDGLIGDDGMIEVKCPYRARYTTIPEHYYPQVQLQLACTDRDWADFVVWRLDEPLIIQRIIHNPAWLASNLPACEAFLADYNAIIRDEKLAAPYLAPLVTQRDDEAWADAAGELKQASKARDDAEAWYEEARAHLVDLSGGRTSEGAGVRLLRIERQGAVQYKQVVSDLLPAGLDLDLYRKPPTVSYRVEIS